MRVLVRVLQRLRHDPAERHLSPWSASDLVPPGRLDRRDEIRLLASESPQLGDQLLDRGVAGPGVVLGRSPVARPRSAGPPPEQRQRSRALVEQQMEDGGAPPCARRARARRSRTAEQCSVAIREPARSPARAGRARSKVACETTRPRTSHLSPERARAAGRYRHGLPSGEHAGCPPLRTASAYTLYVPSARRGGPTRTAPSEECLPRNGVTQCQ